MDTFWFRVPDELTYAFRAFYLAKGSKRGDAAARYLNTLDPTDVGTMLDYFMLMTSSF